MHTYNIIPHSSNTYKHTVTHTNTTTHTYNTLPHSSNTYKHTHTHTNTPTHRHTSTHLQHTSTHIQHIKTYSHTHKYTLTQLHHSSTHIQHTQIYSHTHKYTYTHSLTHKYTCTHLQQTSSLIVDISRAHQRGVKNINFMVWGAPITFVSPPHGYNKRTNTHKNTRYTTINSENNNQYGRIGII